MQQIAFAEAHTILPEDLAGPPQEAAEGQGHEAAEGEGHEAAEGEAAEGSSWARWIARDL